ncbi:hypothetical protein RhiirC2_780222 [Rhizophagus irregularis]|uniref:Uncharacterized protein n=1 Tax=Rhizophagus irregularis TaxID=588596 RepID=A0A2N1N814_9GLOM|nr:hypothetical protein RhiirC2_780222 [Rhizophagus irregularis]
MVFWIFLDLAQDLDLSGQTLMASSLVFRRVGNSEGFSVHNAHFEGWTPDFLFLDGRISKRVKNSAVLQPLQILRI